MIGKITKLILASAIAVFGMGKVHLEERMASRNATHVLDYAEQLGMGTQKYVLITIE